MSRGVSGFLGLISATLYLQVGFRQLIILTTGYFREVYQRLQVRVPRAHNILNYLSIKKLPQNKSGLISLSRLSIDQIHTQTKIILCFNFITRHWRRVLMLLSTRKFKTLMLLSLFNARIHRMQEPLGFSQGLIERTSWALWVLSIFCTKKR